jgi:DNA-binding MarR family transcriptional regulator
MARSTKSSIKSKVLNREKYIPFHLINLANGLSRSASRVYLANFDIGIIEWRILSILSIESSVTSVHICQSIELDRAAASRSLRVLEEMKLVTVTKDKADNRKRLIIITAKGKSLHDKILEIALKREKLLLKGLSKDQLTELRMTLKALSENATEVYKYDAEVIKSAT